MAKPIQQIADEIYREFYGLDHKRFDARKTGEIVDWLTEGDLENMTLEDLKTEWAEYDAREIQERMG